MVKRDFWTNLLTKAKNVNRNELGYALGIGLQAKSGFSLGLRYNGAFTDFAKQGYSDSDMMNARNSVFLLPAGFLMSGR